MGMLWEWDVFGIGIFRCKVTKAYRNLGFVVRTTKDFNKFELYQILIFFPGQKWHRICLANLESATGNVKF